MYGRGAGSAAGVGAGLGATTMLPETGMNLAVQLAVAIVAGLAVWALVYGTTAKFGKR